MSQHVLRAGDGLYGAPRIAHPAVGLPGLPCTSVQRSLQAVLAADEYVGKRYAKRLSAGTRLHSASVHNTRNCSSAGAWFAGVVSFQMRCRQTRNSTTARSTS